MLAGLHAGNIKPPPGLKNIVEFRFIRRICDPFIKRKNPLITASEARSSEPGQEQKSHNPASPAGSHTGGSRTPPLSLMT